MLTRNMVGSPPPRDRLARWILASGMDLVFDLDRSRGAYLYDSQQGQEYLDFFGFFASRPLGFNHEGLEEPAFTERLTQAAKIKPSNCDVYTEYYATFVDRFASGPLSGEFRHVFFIDGGALAVENAMKAAFDWKHRKNLDAGRRAQGSKILHFSQGFHGRSGYTLSVTDSPDPRKTMYFPRFDWPRVSNPKMRFPFDTAAREEVEAREARSLEEITEAFDRDGDDIAAILIEPIQGEGGDNYFRSEFLRALRRICDEREALLIFDEVQTGFGATGSWWDWQNHEAKPDLLCFGKKTQVCGFAAARRIDEIDSVFKVPSRISSTFEGNLVDMVRCTQIIDIIERDRLLANATTMGAYMLKLVRDLASSHDSIDNARGRGLWVAFDLPTREERDRLVDACFRERLILLPCGTHSIRLRPALDIDADSIARAIAQVEAGFRRAFK